MRNRQIKQIPPDKRELVGADALRRPRSEVTKKMMEAGKITKQLIPVFVPQIKATIYCKTHERAEEIKRRYEL